MSFTYSKISPSIREMTKQKVYSKWMAKPGDKDYDKILARDMKECEKPGWTLVVYKRKKRSVFST
jgi:hypothetical protein